MTGRLTPPLDGLFDALDLERDGELSRAELRQAARNFRWHWPEAPLYAVLDRFTVDGAIRRREFRGYLQQILADRRGPYGQVLAMLAPPPLTRCEPTPASSTEDSAEPSPAPTDSPEAIDPTRQDSLTEVLKQLADESVARRYQDQLRHLAARKLALEPERTALLLIDPQRSFTRGAWMQSVGRGAEQDVAPLRVAFARCASHLRRGPRWAAFMASRCPFPPASYGWDEPLGAVLPEAQPYFIKPGNSILWPPTNGFQRWVQRLLTHGIDTLILGGCTLNSCVRVSACDISERFGRAGLQVVVDLSLCGARLSNYRPSGEFYGRSSVEAAIEQMRAAGVEVTETCGDSNATASDLQRAATGQGK